MFKAIIFYGRHYLFLILAIRRYAARLFGINKGYYIRSKHHKQIWQQYANNDGLIWLVELRQTNVDQVYMNTCGC